MNAIEELRKIHDPADIRAAEALRLMRDIVLELADRLDALERRLNAPKEQEPNAPENNMLGYQQPNGSVVWVGQPKT